MQRIEFDLKSPTAREDVSLIIRSLLGLSLDSKCQKSTFYLVDRFGQPQVLTKWLLEKCSPGHIHSGFYFTARVGAVEGFQKLGLKGGINYAGLVVCIFLLERLFGNPFPFSVPRLNYQRTLPVSMNMLYVLSWFAFSLASSRIPIVIFYAKLYYPKCLSILADIRMKEKSITEHAWILVFYGIPNYLLENLPIGFRRGWIELRSLLVALRAIVRYSIPVILLSLVLCLEFSIAFHASTMLVLIALVGVVTGKDIYKATRVSEKPGPCVINLAISYCGEQFGTFQMTSNGPVGPYFKVYVNNVFTPYFNVTPNPGKRGSQKPFLEIGLVFGAIVVGWLYGHQISGHIFVQLSILYALVFLWPPVETNSSCQQFKVSVYNLKSGSEFDICVSCLDYTGGLISSSNSLGMKTTVAGRPNRMFYIYEDSKIYRASSVLWGQLDSKNKPALKNEYNEVDSVLATIRAVMLDVENIQTGSDQPDAIFSYPQSGSKHVPLSHHFVQKTVPTDKTLRVHPAGTKVGSYNLEAEIWNNLKVARFTLPGQLLVAYFLVCSMLNGNNLNHKLGSVLDSIRFGNTALLALMILKRVDRNYLFVGCIAVMIAFWADSII
mmetsp:Transcript_4748/g.8524  ORF Transcript_4748/g.8524 Transcript_4748/m.8524 type:complete len:607 (+) Transcript_4748:863-2683(+)